MGAPTFTVEFSVTERGRKVPEWTLDADIDGELTLADLLEFSKSSLILIADQVLKEEQARGFEKSPVIAVDGKIGKAISDVNPWGSIVFTASQELGEILSFIATSIESRSPVLTGRYKSSNIVLFNGTQIAAGPRELDAWIAYNVEKITPGDRFRFVNTQPYARKLERYGVANRSGGKPSKKRLKQAADKRERSGGKILAPNGTYYLTSIAARRKFKFNLKIAFKYIPGSEMGLADPSQQHFFKKPSKASRSKSNKTPRTYLYPSIVIELASQGVTGVNDVVGNS